MLKTYNLKESQCKCYDTKSICGDEDFHLCEACAKSMNIETEKQYIYVILKNAPFDHNEYVTAFSTEELAQEFIKINQYKQMWIVKQELK